MFVMYHRHRDTASHFTRAQSSARVEESTDLRRKCGKARVSIVDRNWSFISSSASSLESRYSARICVHVSARVYMYICFFFPSAYINADQYRLHTCEKTREKESTREAGREGRQGEVSKKSVAAARDARELPACVLTLVTAVHDAQVCRARSFWRLTMANKGLG